MTLLQESKLQKKYSGEQSFYSYVSLLDCTLINYQYMLNI